MYEIKKVSYSIPQYLLDFVNQIFEIEKKVNSMNEENSIQRNINKIKILLEEELFKGNVIVGLTYYNPLGEKYSDTRTDCEATIAGTSTENLEIVEVIKPIVFCSYIEEGNVIKSIVQKAVVVAKSINSN